MGEGTSEELGRGDERGNRKRRQGCEKKMKAGGRDGREEREGLETRKTRRERERKRPP